MKLFPATLLLLTLAAPAWAQNDDLAKGEAFMGNHAASSGNFAEAAKWWRKAANHGHTKAHYYLGKLYRFGTGVPQDFAEAIKRHRKAAVDGIPEAQVSLGDMYALGQGVPQDYAKTLKWWRKAADQGLARAQYLLGVMHLSGEGVPQNDAEAVTWFRKAATQGHADAQFRLGLMFGKGRGVPQDFEETLKWLRKAAEQGLPVAQHILGKMYHFGRGVVQDYAQAAQWYQKAAEQGVALAQSQLGGMYLTGRGVPQDYVLSHMWLNLAAARGSERAPIARDSLAKDMTATDIAKAQRLALEWMAAFEKKSGSGKVAKVEKPEAQSTIGDKKAQGQNVQQGDAETPAMAQLRKAAEQDDANAQTTLGVIYMNGQGVPKDYSKALIWFRKAALLSLFRKGPPDGMPIAQYNLGAMYARGLGVPQDYSEAFKWIHKAAKQGHATAQYDLGGMYSNGQGVPLDEAEAANWYRKAAKQGNALAQFALTLSAQGQSVKQDDTETPATVQLRKAAEKGDADAQYDLGVVYSKGLGVPQDEVQAFKWIHKAAEQELAKAEFSLGYSYTNGKGTKQNYGQALHWYKRAANHGSTDAMNNLSLAYTNGRGVEVDKGEMFRWAKMAAERGHIDAQAKMLVYYLSGIGVQKDMGKALAWGMVVQLQRRDDEMDLMVTTLSEKLKRDNPNKYRAVVKLAEDLFRQYVGPYVGTAPTPPIAPIEENSGGSDSDFREIKLGVKFDPIKQGYEQLNDIAGAPGVRINHFEKSYQGGSVTNAVGIYRGLAILKLQNALQDNKAECQQNIVRMVEGLQKVGIVGWKNSWRKDYDVPVYRVDVQYIRAKITCRGNEVGWFLEYSQAIRGEQLKKLLR